jgi:hypothetical protein
MNYKRDEHPVVHIVELEAFSHEELLEIPSHVVVVRLFVELQLPAVLNVLLELI